MYVTEQIIYYLTLSHNTHRKKSFYSILLGQMLRNSPSSGQPEGKPYIKAFGSEKLARTSYIKGQQSIKCYVPPTPIVLCLYMVG